MPQVNDDGFMVHKVRKGGVVKEIKLKPVSYEEVQRRAARDDFDGLTDEDMRPEQAETVDVAEVQREIRRAGEAEDKAVEKERRKARGDE